MKKTNIIVEVNDEIYESVVAPFKKRKSFGKLMVQLLEAYTYNEAIYSYINGVMDGIEHDAMEDLLNDLTSSISMMGMLGSQAEAIIENGQRDFESIRQGSTEANFTVDKEPVPDEPKGGVTREDVQNIVAESMSGIESMLKELLSHGTLNTGNGSVGNGRIYDSPREEVRQSYFESPAVNKEEFKPKAVTVEEVDTYKKVVPEEKEVVYKEPSSEDESMAQDALASLLGSVGF